MTPSTGPLVNRAPAGFQLGRSPSGGFVPPQRVTEDKEHPPRPRVDRAGAFVLTGHQLPRVTIRERV
jgi:hypothetical protein